MLLTTLEYLQASFPKQSAFFRFHGVESGRDHLCDLTQ